MTDEPLGASPEQIRALQELVLATDTLQDFLGAVAERATSIGPDLACGITVSTDPRRPLTVGSSDATAAQLDETQYRHDEGPCLETMRTNKIIEVTDAATETRWTGYITPATDQGLGASLSTPITASGVTIGVMNLYATTPHTFTSEERARAQAYADQAAAAIAVATRLAHHSQLTDDLRSAMASRTTIDQALGILMGELRCNADDAFAVLCKLSQDTNTKLRDVAATVITHTTGEPPRPTRPIGLAGELTSPGQAARIGPDLACGNIVNTAAVEVHAQASEHHQAKPSASGRPPLRDGQD
jgi:transcriptional regulator with GAF, ATPase, and Fis domain